MTNLRASFFAGAAGMVPRVVGNSDDLYLDLRCGRANFGQRDRSELQSCNDIQLDEAGPFVKAKVLLVSHLDARDRVRLSFD